MMEQLGPSLAQALIYNVSGNAARSELDKLCEPLKRIVVRQVCAKTWLEKALTHVEISNQIVNDAERRIFLQKVIRYSDQLDLVKQFVSNCPLQSPRFKTNESGGEGFLAFLSGIQLCICIMKEFSHRQNSSIPRKVSIILD